MGKPNARFDEGTRATLICTLNLFQASTLIQTKVPKGGVHWWG